MSRIFIGCFILVIYVHSSSLATSVNVAEIAGHAQSEFEIPYGTRQKRATQGTEITLGECAQIGRTCSISRDKTDQPTKVTVVPCCVHLFCAGIGPNEVRNGFGQAIRGDEYYSTGVCSLVLDNDQGATDQGLYNAYVEVI